MTENEWDKLLRIRTTGIDKRDSDAYRYPYEPTPYKVLLRLANEGLIDKKNVFLDYGCGKGRVSIFISYQIKCSSIGIEYNSRIYETAMANKEASVSGNKVTFVCEDAKRYTLPAEVDRIFFFNPFAIELFQSVLARIIESYDQTKREVFLFFYYPSDEYIACLMQQERLSFYDEIDCRDLFDGKDSRERIMIFTIE